MKNTTIMTLAARSLLSLFGFSTAAMPSYAQWVQPSSSLNNVYISCIATSGMQLFVGCEYNGGIFLSTDKGADWSQVDSGLTGTWVSSLAVSGTNIFAGLWYGGGVALSSDNGASWSSVNSGLTRYWVHCLAISGTNIFAGTDSEGVFLPTNNGTSWETVDSGLATSYVLSLYAFGGDLFAGTVNSGIYRSTNNGISWNMANSGLPNSNIEAFCGYGTKLFTATAGGVFLTTDMGQSWSAVGLSGLWVTALTFSGTNLFAGTLHNGVYLSTNDGANWVTADSGLMSYYQGGMVPPGVTALAVSGTDLFAGTITQAGNGFGLWRRPISEMITEVKYNNTQLPKAFALEQNYPNPFNPTTTIAFTLSATAFTSIMIFDLLGNEVATIVSKQMPAGIYAQQWDARNMPSGAYICRMQVGSFIETRKIVLLK